MPMETRASNKSLAQRRQRNLYLRRVDKNFVPGHDIVTDLWCLDGSDNQAVDFSQVNISSPFKSVGEYIEAGEKAKQLATCFADRLGQEFNKSYATRYSQRFWFTVLIYWVYELTQLSWSRYKLLHEIVEQNSDDQLCASVWLEDKNWNFENASSFANTVLSNDDFHWWVDSQILSALAPKNCEFIHELPDTDIVPSIRTNLSEPKGSLISLCSQWLKRYFGFTNVTGAYFSVVWLAIFKTLLPARRFVAPDRLSPEQDITNKFPKAYVTVLEKLLRLTIPKTFSDNFLPRAAKFEATRFRPGHLRFGTLDWKNDDERLVFALAQEHGERIMQFQHGGSYGTALAHPTPSLIEYSQDYFATWGWRGHSKYEGHFVPLPSPWLSRHANRHNTKNDTLILVGTHIPLRLQRLAPTVQPFQAIDYLNGKERFVKHLDPAPWNCLRYRPYRRAIKSFDDVSYFKTRGIKFETIDANFEEALLQCKLLVLDHDSTTLNFALAANIPTVCFINPKMFPICEQAKSAFQSLYDQGILFPDAAAAANHINTVWNDINAWWKSEPVQQARKNWVNQYALNSRFWWFEWMKDFYRLQRQ
jgi:putative transferase (TIGR04331 family)